MEPKKSLNKSRFIKPLLSGLYGELVGLLICHRRIAVARNLRESIFK